MIAAAMNIGCPASLFVALEDFDEASDYVGVSFFGSGSVSWGRD